MCSKEVPGQAVADMKELLARTGHDEPGIWDPSTYYWVMCYRAWCTGHGVPGMVYRVLHERGRRTGVAARIVMGRTVDIAD